MQFWKHGRAGRSLGARTIIDFVQYSLEVVARIEHLYAGRDLNNTFHSKLIHTCASVMCYIL